MLEIVFSNSTAGSMAVAMNHPPAACETVGVVLDSDGRKPARLETWLATRKARRENAKNWARSVPLEGRREDILCFPLALNVGPIDDPLGPQREAVLTGLLPWPDAQEQVQDMLKTARENLDTLLVRAKEEPIRFWASGDPMEVCGLCFLLDQLRPLGLEKLNLSLVSLPHFVEGPDGVITEYSGWGDAAPYEMGRFAAGGERLTPARAGMLANRWRDLQQENAPLRAELNGTLVSVPESWYDPFLLRELEKQPTEFWEAHLIGSVLGKYRLGVGDGWLHSRIETLIRQGLLEPVTVPEPGEAAYRRALRKRT